MALGKGLNSLIPQQQPRKTIRKETGKSDVANLDKVWEIPLSEIVPNQAQPRKVFDDAALAELVASIKKHGILQPISVTEKEDGGYELIAGERRTRASQLAGKTTIPAIVRSVTDQEKLELALIENIQREDLNPIEEAFSYKRLIDEFGLTQQDVADQVGKSRSAIANTIRLLDLPEPIQKALIDGVLSSGKARALLSLKSQEEQQEMFESMIGSKMTVRDVEASVAAKGSGSRKGSTRRDPNILAQEQLLEERFGTRVHISSSGEKGTIQISYTSKEELKRLLSELS